MKYFLVVELAFKMHQNLDSDLVNGRAREIHLAK